MQKTGFRALRGQQREPGPSKYQAKSRNHDLYMILAKGQPHGTNRWTYRSALAFHLQRYIRYNDTRSPRALCKGVDLTNYDSSRALQQTRYDFHLLLLISGGRKCAWRLLLIWYPQILTCGPIGCAFSAVKIGMERDGGGGGGGSGE